MYTSNRLIPKEKCMVKTENLKHITLLIFLVFCIYAPISAKSKNVYPIIPIPEKVVADKGKFIFDSNTSVYIESGESDEINKAFYLFRNQFERVANISLKGTNKKKIKNVIICKVNNDIKEEGYQLKISVNSIRIEAKSAVGFFYALQTIRQLLPAEFEGKEKQLNREWTVNACSIKDTPEFVYRGYHLDVCRHFIPIEEIKTYIDQMAMLKLNIFHWHLTDDQAWRIEIKKYPKLISVGSVRNRTLVGHTNDYPRVWDYTKTEGHYTQEQIRELVAYAQERFVTIIPEIEMPGHATAAMASYPEFSCSGGPVEVEGRWGVFNEIFCTKDETFEFIENVLTEVSALFPSTYLHIGGDEAPKVRWERCHICQERIKNENLKDEHELQSYFIKRVEKIAHKLGKRIIGWDEILDGGLAADATVMSWRGVSGGVKAAKLGHDVIMAPSVGLYFDFYQSQLHDDPLTIGGYVPIERVYSFNPYTTELTFEERKHVLGVQANTWTEYMPTQEIREFMIFPRMAALAEVAWSRENNKDFEAFANRIPFLLARYDQIGIGYSEALYSVKLVPVTIDNELRLKLETAAPNTTIYYTLDGSEPTSASAKYTTPIKLGDKSVTLKAIAASNGKMKYRTHVRDFVANKAAGQKLTFTSTDGNSFSQDGSGNLTDCMMGGRPVSRPDWFSYAGSDGAILIDFSKPEVISTMTFSSANQNSVLVYSPKLIDFQVSTDGETFHSVGSVAHADMAANNGRAIVTFDPVQVKKVKLNIQMYGIIPDTEPNNGQMSALFADEIIIQ